MGFRVTGTASAADVYSRSPVNDCSGSRPSLGRQASFTPVPSLVKSASTMRIFQPAKRTCETRGILAVRKW